MATAPRSKAVLRSDNSTGYHGVTPVGKGFVAQIYHSGKTHRSKVFGKKIDAAKEYDKMAIQAQKDGVIKRAKLNFPPKANK